MARGRIYTPYKRILTTLGLHQLDVYRIRDPDSGKVKDVIRVYSPTANRVAVIDLGAPRESLSLSDYLERVVKGLRSSKIAVPERVLKRLREELAAQEPQKEATSQAQA